MAGRLLAQLSTKKKGERKRNSKLKILELLHFVAMFSAPVDGSANHSDGWRRLRETARSRRPLFFFYPHRVGGHHFHLASLLALSLSIFNIYFYSFSFPLLPLCSFFLLFPLWLLYCYFIFWLFGFVAARMCFLYSILFCYIVLVCSFSIFFFLRAISVDGFSLSFSIFSDTWQMVVVMSEFVSRGVVAFSTPRLS